MGFYSSLILAANHGADALTDDVADALLVQCGIVVPDSKGEFGHDLANDLLSIFQTAEALQKNDQFFCPYQVMFSREISILHPHFETEYEAPGWSFSFHGEGYFFPWEPSDFRTQFTQNEKMQHFRDAIQKRAGGTFKAPLSSAAILKAAWIDYEEGWIWFGSQSI